MKITVQDADLVNWDKVAESVRNECAKKIVEVTKHAMESLKNLKPGERKTFPIKVGAVTISRPKE